MAYYLKSTFAAFLLVGGLFAQPQAAQPAAAVQIPRPVVPGTIVTPGGGLCQANFLVDTGASTSFMGQSCATGAGLGTVGPPNSTFTPNPGLGAVCRSFNGGIVQAWCFPGLTLMAIDSSGHVCFKTVEICVVKELNNGQANTLNHGIISYGWLSCVGGSVGGYGQVHWGSASTVVNGQQSQAANLQGNLQQGGSYETFSAMVIGRPRQTGGTPPQIPVEVRISSTLGTHFIPASLAQALNLVVGPSVDLSQTDPESLEALDRLNVRQNGQTVFSTTILPSFSWMIGGARSDKAYIIDDANTAEMIVGSIQTPLMEDFILVMDMHYSATTVLSYGVPNYPAPPNYTVIGATPVATTTGGLGDLNLEPILPAVAFSEGATLVSADASEAISFGPMFGVYPDSLTWASVLAPVQPGSVFRFNNTSGVFPHVPLRLPPGTLNGLAGLTLDIAMVYVTPGGIVTTGPTRVSF